MLLRSSNLCLHLLVYCFKLTRTIAMWWSYCARTCLGASLLKFGVSPLQRCSFTWCMQGDAESSSAGASSHFSCDEASTSSSSGPLYISRRLADAFNFPVKISDAIVHNVGREKLERSMLCKARYGTTHFTGAGTAEMGTDLLRPAFARHGLFMPMQYIHMCDNDPRSQSFNMDKRLHRGSFWPHCFPNILAFTEASHVGSQNNKNNEAKANLVCESRIVTRAWCIRHQAMCPLQGPHFDQSGSPCWDWTRDGNHAGLDGDTIVLFVTFGRFHTWWGTWVVVHENVPGFLLWLARTFLPDHIIHDFEVTPKLSGFPMISRVRQYLICRHRHKVDLHYDPYKLLKQISASLATECTVRDVFFSSPATVRIAEIDICKTRKIQLRPFTLPQDLDYTLTEAECGHVRNLDLQYFSRTGLRADQNPDLCYNLTDNPDNRVSWTFNSGTIPTLRRNTNRLYFPHLRRCLTGEELLALQGFAS